MGNSKPAPPPEKPKTMKGKYLYIKNYQKNLRKILENNKETFKEKL